MPGGQTILPIRLKRGLMGFSLGGERASAPISTEEVADLRRLILRTLNGNQLLILNQVSRQDRSMTSLLRSMSEEFCVPLSTLKLNARILREMNLISYGSVRESRNAGVEPLGSLVLRLIREEPTEATIRFSD